MHARLSRWAGLPPERLDQTVRGFEEGFLPQLEQMAGYSGVAVMIDRESGKAAAVTFWETADQMRASDKLAEEARAAAAATVSPSDPVREPSVDHYEVVVRN